MNLPSLAKVGNQSLDTLARIGGATVGKIALSAIKKQGLVFSLMLFIGGLAVTIFGPDKFKVKEIGEGLALFGGLKVINDLTQPVIDWGLGTATPSALNAVGLPEPIRNFLSQAPSMSGVGMTIYPVNHPRIQAEDGRAVVMNGMPVFNSNAGMPKAPSVVNMGGMGIVPVLAA